MKIGQSIMRAARSNEVEESVEKSRPFDCLIRSVRVERIIGRRCFPCGSSDSHVTLIEVTCGTLSAPAWSKHALANSGN